MLHIFERGYAEVDSIEYCARVIARRCVQQDHVEEHGVFGAKWDVDSKGMKISMNKPEAHMEKLYENQHLETCEETNEMVASRRANRTNTDMVFDSTLKDLAATDANAEEQAQGDQRV
mmetsp:Transcript_88953/g.157479  ORF Transcript_88953/g.157479 Transcript_88953/m.157479 type:complete len:118 (-) Transcript_88953:56-409(-)